MAAEVAAPFDVDRAAAWRAEMRHAVSRRATHCGRQPALQSRACSKRFLEEETTEPGRVEEMREAITLLREASQRNGRSNAANPSRDGACRGRA
jgi:hypothetical protein